MIDLDELVAEARKAQSAVYLATEEAVADDLSRIIAGLADALVSVRAERDEALADKFHWHEVATKAKDQRDAALARIAELEKELALLQVPEGYPKRPSARAWAAILDRANTAEARIAEAAKLHRKRRAFADDWNTCTCGYDAIPCPTAEALGLNEGENK